MTPEAPEFSRPFPVDKLRDRPMREAITANEEECEALAKRLDLVAIKQLQADFTLSSVPSGEMVEVVGRFEARVVQHCVVTLEPFEAEVGEPIRAYFTRPENIKGSEDMEVEDERAPEPISPHGEIDLGELTAQHLSLALDPYPRKPGVEFKPVIEDTPAVPVKAPSPFAVLAEYRDKKKP